MLEDVTLESFAALVDETFAIAWDGGEIGAVLVEACPLADGAGSPREAPGRDAPFSLEFLGPGEPLLPQGTYRFSHDALGALEIFVVPVAQDERGVRYEAIFT